MSFLLIISKLLVISYTLNFSRPELAFADINECTEDTNSCDSNASCINTIGSYNCTCNFGFQGDGRNCTGMYNVYCHFLKRMFCLQCVS